MPTLIILSTGRTLQVTGDLDHVHHEVLAAHGSPVRLERVSGNQQVAVYVNPSHIAYYEPQYEGRAMHEASP